MNFPMM